MNWKSWQELAAMGGYGLYVWGSLALVLVAIVIEQIGLKIRKTAALRPHGRAFRRRHTKDEAAT